MMTAGFSFHLLGGGDFYLSCGYLFLFGIFVHFVNCFIFLYLSLSYIEPLRFN